MGVCPIKGSRFEVPNLEEIKGEMFMKLLVTGLAESPDSKKVIGLNMPENPLKKGRLHPEKRLLKKVFWPLGSYC